MNQRETDNDSGIERRVLANMLHDPEKVIPLMGFFRPEDFSRREHRTIYETLLSLTKQEPEQHFDFITVVEELEKQNQLTEIGGARYIEFLLRQISDGLFPSETLYPTETLFPASTPEYSVQPSEEKNETQVQTILLFGQEELARPEIQLRLRYRSPSYHLLEKILEDHSFLDTLHWRDFEKLVADLLEKDGYHVQLGPGTKDGGKDIIAMKDLGEHGWFMSVWQAKKLKPGNRVNISIIRELADTRQKQNASKGIIVTSTYLTRDALNRVTEDQFLLAKVDRNDLLQWIQRVKRKQR